MPELLAVSIIAIVAVIGITFMTVNATKTQKTITASICAEKKAALEAQNFAFTTVVKKIQEGHYHGKPADEHHKDFDYFVKRYLNEH